ncbi:MAG: sulfotransferase [Stellaceae bacterium]
MTSPSDSVLNRPDGSRPPFRGSGAILIFGLPRSGTSWLAKIFDSHPDVLYRHEPDISYREDRLPKYCPVSEMQEHLGFVRNYLDGLARVRTLKAAGSLPVFAKRGRSALARFVRGGLILGMRVTESVIGNHEWLAQVPIPDLIASRYRHQTRIVIKSVSAEAYVRLFAEAWPESRIIVIVRHPCGQVASFIQGIRLGKFAPPDPLGEVSRSPEAERLRVKVEEPTALSTVEQLAWEWAFLNQRMLNDLSCLSRARIIKYEELAADPIGVARDLFAFADLSWNAQTESFIATSTMSDGGDRYYSLTRNPLHAANHWRDTLSIDDQQRIGAMACRVAVGRSFVQRSRDAVDADEALAQWRDG